MEIPDLPDPKYELKRYSSKVLLCWLERAMLVNCIARREYSHRLRANEPALLIYGKAREAGMYGLKLVEILKERDFDPVYLNALVDDIEEDVFS